jgi:HD-GYP domain-containing protein (c-di-GMP phosphodiesterase class II)
MKEMGSIDLKETRFQSVAQSGPGDRKEDDLLLETKILMVADVVEAMASHRPFRPALGIEMALEEIEKNKGALYDPDVAEVCLKLFREKGFKFTL